MPKATALGDRDLHGIDQVLDVIQGEAVCGITENEVPVAEAKGKQADGQRPTRPEDNAFTHDERRDAATLGEFGHHAFCGDLRFGIGVAEIGAVVEGRAFIDALAFCTGPYTASELA